MEISDVQNGLQCFYCVAEMVSKQEYGYKNNVVTQYQGTLVCCIHALKLFDKENRYENEVFNSTKSDNPIHQ